ncbi:MAG: hypothetical protein ABFS05_10670 [Bacteroidota bacterium]
MFLILDQQQTEFSLKLKDTAENKGIKTLYLTSTEIAQDLVLAFQLTDKKDSFKLRYRDTSIESQDLYGIYCGIHNFWPELWPRYTAEDARYAAQETYSLWVAMLASLSCRVINQPALDALAGTVLSKPETLHLAQKLGFRIPMIITLESGKVAADLSSSNTALQYADLGQNIAGEIELSDANKSDLQQSNNHCRITEIVAGQPAFVTLVGEQFFACCIDDRGMYQLMKNNDIPISEKTRIQNMQKELNLNMAEYYFRISKDNTWIFSGYGLPPSYSVKAFGDRLYDYIVNYAIGNGGS